MSEIHDCALILYTLTPDGDVPTIEGHIRLDDGAWWFQCTGDDDRRYQLHIRFCPECGEDLGELAPLTLAPHFDRCPCPEHPGSLAAIPMLEMTR